MPLREESSNAHKKAEDGSMLSVIPAERTAAKFKGRKASIIEGMDLLHKMERLEREEKKTDFDPFASAGRLENRSNNNNNNNSIANNSLLENSHLDEVHGGDVSSIEGSHKNEALSHKNKSFSDVSSHVSNRLLRSKNASGGAEQHQLQDGKQTNTGNDNNSFSMSLSSDEDINFDISDYSSDSSSTNM
jgi:hypothetical protein